jgi:hypothetical protein
MKSAVESFGLILLLISTSCASQGKKEAEGHSLAVERAVQFLAREVPAWNRENGCYSCHNNGDGARVLHVARQNGFVLDEKVLSDTSKWLEQPGQWEHNKGDPGFSDQRLANLQFASALLALTGANNRNPALAEAVQKVLKDQGADGAWHIDEESRVGSPTTYGPNLATYMGWQLLQSSPNAEVKIAAAKAREWLLHAPISNIPAAAVFITAFGKENERLADKIDSALALIKKGQTREGGWGPYADAPPEVFDSALVLLALRELKDPEVSGMIARGRDFLVASQRSEGSWPGTTRPSGGNSYAQTISTTAWALEALLKTQPIN